MATETALTAKVDGSAVAGLALAAAGARHMFGVVGIPVTSLASRAAAAGVRFIAFRNEQSSGYAAAAYGFLTGTPGLLLTVSGPGCVHGLAGLSHATANAWPLLMVSGSCSQSDVGRGDFQELDQIAATKPFAKLAVKATAIADIPRLVFQALAATVAGRPGGCYLDIPSDVLHQTLTQSEADALIAAAAADAAAAGSSPPKHKSLDDGIVKAAELLHRAERPLVVFGKGAAYARAEEAIQKLVDTTGIPFLPTPMGKGVVPDAHPLSATAARSLAIGQCDVALIVGARLNWLLHFGEPPKWSKDVKFILVDVDEDEIELRKPHLGLVGDAKRVVELINREIKDQPFCLARSHPWVAAITKKAKDNVLKMEAQLAKDVVPFNFMTPLRIIRDAILAEGSPAPIVVSEGANTMDVGRAVLVQNEPRTRLDAGTWGTMGVGLGYCIAAAVAEPNRLVVAVEGDSGFGFSAMEVETLVRYQLPVVVIVFNNNGVYGASGYQSEDSSGHDVDGPSVGRYYLLFLLCGLFILFQPDDDDDENSSPMYEQDHAINLPVKKAFSRVNADSSKVAANKDDPLEADFNNYVLKCKSVYKCKLCPRIMCLSEDMVRVHLESKRHARSKKLLGNGRLKMMLNSDGELEEEAETHAERHARTIALAQQVQKPKKDSGRQRQLRRRQKKRSRNQLEKKQQPESSGKEGAAKQEKSDKKDAKPEKSDKKGARREKDKSDKKRRKTEK
ncbi:hypothetical protein ACQ4PT_068489 [Festuca glaucescens]